LEENIRKVKLSTPDYRDMDPEQAVADFRQRREMYMRVYEPVDMSDGPHIKIVNSRQFIGTVNIIGSRGLARIEWLYFTLSLTFSSHSVRSVFILF
jgi:6-phosphofructo-2-kinase